MFNEDSSEGFAMDYRQVFTQTVHDVLEACALPRSDEFWPEAFTTEGVNYGQQEELEAPEAATWYLSAAALIRMQEGALGAPATARIVRSARRLADARNLSPALRDALLRVDEERRSWVLENHEFQGAQLRALRPVKDSPEVFENRPFGDDLPDPRDPAESPARPSPAPTSIWDAPGFEAAVDDYPGTDWPGLLDRLLDEDTHATG
jgi:hypothetical protein